MELRPLGRTGIDVAPIGFGAFKIGRNQKTKYAEAYELPTDREVETLLDGILEAGINLIDTAPAYGTSEQRIGDWLRRSGCREEVVLCSKVGERFEDGRSDYAFDRESVNRSIDESLRRLGVERIDLVSVHSDGRDLEIIRNTEVLETIAERKARGDIRLTGFSGKTLEGHRAVLGASPMVDVLMIELNPLETAQAPLLFEAQRCGVGLLVKKGLGSGRLEASQALPWLLAHEEISSVVVGGLSLGNVRRNVSMARR